MSLDNAVALPKSGLSSLPTELKSFICALAKQQDDAFIAFKGKKRVEDEVFFEQDQAARHMATIIFGGKSLSQLSKTCRELRSLCIPLLSSVLSLMLAPLASLDNTTIETVIGLSYHLHNLRELRIDSWFADRCLPPPPTTSTELQASFIELAGKITRLVMVDMYPHQMVELLPHFPNLVYLEVQGGDEEEDTLNFKDCSDFLPTLRCLRNLKKVAFLTIANGPDFIAPPLPPSPDDNPSLFSLHISSRYLRQSEITFISSLQTLKVIRLDFGSMGCLPDEFPLWPEFRSVILAGPELFIANVLQRFLKCTLQSVELQLVRAYTYTRSSIVPSETFAYFMSALKTMDAVETTSRRLLPSGTELRHWVELDEEQEDMLFQRKNFRMQTVLSDSLFWDGRAPFQVEEKVKQYKGNLLAVEEAREYVSNVVGTLLATKDTVGASQLLVQLEGLRGFKMLEQE